MADVSRSTYRGLLIPDARITADSLWAAQSTYDEALLRPGVPEPQDDTRLTLAAVGTQSADGAIVVTAHRGGFPEPGGGTFRWTSGGATYGWDVPTIIASWEAVVWLDGSSTPVLTRDPHVVSLADGKVAVAYYAEITTGLNYRVHVATRSAANVWTTGISAWLQADAPADGSFFPTLVLLPTGRLLVFHLVEDLTAVTAQVRMAYSDDDGASWTQGQPAGLPSAIDQSGAPGAGAAGYDIQRMRAAYKDGQVLLLLQARAHNTTPATRDILFQYASDDLGATFALVDTTGTTEIWNYQDITVAGEFFVVGVIGPGSAGTTRAAVVRLANAYELLTDQTPINASDDIACATLSGTSHLTDGDMAVWTDEDGVVYLSARAVAGDEFFILRSFDDGETWSSMGQGLSAGSTEYSVWWDSDDLSTSPRAITGCSQGGRQLILHNWDAAPGNEDNSLGCVYLGGYSTITMPGISEFPEDVSRVGFASTYLPFDEPGDVGWTVVGAGTDDLVTPGALEVVTVANSRYYEKAPSGTPEQGIIVKATLEAVAGGNITNGEITVVLRLATGAEGWEVALRFSTTQFRLADVNAGATVGTVTVDMTAGVQIFLALNDGIVHTWYRLLDHDGARAWTTGPTSSTLTDDGGAGGAVNVLRFGNVTAGNATSRWIEMHYTKGADVGLGLADGFTSPADLFGRTFSATPVWVDDGVRIQADAGPAFANEAWAINARSDYSVLNMIPAVAPSPRRRFRSSTAGAQEIAWKIAEAETYHGSTLVALYLDGCNLRTGTWYGYTGGAWATIAAIDLAQNRSGLDYTRKGNAIMPDTGAVQTPKHYIHLNELAGGYADLGGGKKRRILGNTEGLWDDTTTRRVIVFLSDVDESEPASGTVDLVSPRGLVISNIGSAIYQGYKIKINAAGIDAYSEIGIALFGWLAPFGYDYSWGRTWEIEANAEVLTAQDGSRRARTLGPRRRAVEFAWPDGVDSSQLYAASLVPDYLLGSTVAGNTPVALRYDTPYVLAGALDALEGPVRPLVYVESLAKSTGGGTDDAMHVQYRRMLYGRMTGTVQIETVQGNEMSDEVLRVQKVRIEEEV